MKKIALFLTVLFLSVGFFNKIGGQSLVEKGLLSPVSLDLSQFKSLDDLACFYETFFCGREEQLLNDILKRLGVERSEFDGKVQEKEVDRLGSRKRSAETDYGRENHEATLREKPKLVQLFGYDPFGIIEGQLKGIGRNPEDFWIACTYDFDDPDEEELENSFSCGYNNSIYFSKTDFSKEEFEAVIAHEVQHVKNLDFSRKQVLDEVINEFVKKVADEKIAGLESIEARIKEFGLLLESEKDKFREGFKNFVWLTEIRCDIVGSLKGGISSVKAALSSFERELQKLPANLTSEDDEHPSHRDRIDYLRILVEQVKVVSKPRE